MWIYYVQLDSVLIKTIHNYCVHMFITDPIDTPHHHHHTHTHNAGPTTAGAEKGRIPDPPLLATAPCPPRATALCLCPRACPCCSTPAALPLLGEDEGDDEAVQAERLGENEDQNQPHVDLVLVVPCRARPGIPDEPDGVPRPEAAEAAA